MGAFHYAKSSRNFGREINRTLRSGWKISGQSGPHQKVVENWRSILSEILVSSPSPFHHAIAKMADGTEVNLYECSICKLQTQDLNILLMHSCTQGPGTALHLDLLCSVFYFFLNTDILLTFPNVHDVFPRFSLCSI